ncbi:hypothetical protein N9Y89_00470 [bacterium]|nr:hypothetical protein [bacterium]
MGGITVDFNSTYTTDKEIKQTKMLIEKFRAKKSKASFAQRNINNLEQQQYI